MLISIGQSKRQKVTGDEAWPGSTRPSCHCKPLDHRMHRRLINTDKSSTETQPSLQILQPPRKIRCKSAEWHYGFAVGQYLLQMIICSSSTARPIILLARRHYSFLFLMFMMRLTCPGRTCIYSKESMKLLGQYNRRAYIKRGYLQSYLSFTVVRWLGSQWKAALSFWRLRCLSRTLVAGLCDQKMNWPKLFTLENTVQQTRQIFTESSYIQGMPCRDAIFSFFPLQSDVLFFAKEDIDTI